MVVDIDLIIFWTLFILEITTFTKFIFQFRLKERKDDYKSFIIFDKYIFIFFFKLLLENNSKIIF